DRRSPPLGERAFRADLGEGCARSATRPPGPRRRAAAADQRGVPAATQPAAGCDGSKGAADARGGRARRPRAGRLPHRRAVLRRVDHAVRIVTIRTPYRLESERLVIRCWSPEDAPLLKDAVDRSLEHLRPWMPWTPDEPEELEVVAARLRGFRAR